MESCILFKILHLFQYDSWWLKHYQNPNIVKIRNVLLVFHTYCMYSSKRSGKFLKIHSVSTFPPGVSKNPSLWVNDRFSGNNLVQGKSLTRLFVKMSNLSVTRRIRHSSLGKYLQSLSDVDHTLIHSFESQKYLVYILLIRRKVEPGYPIKCKYGAIWFSAFSLLKGSVIKTVLPLISVKCRIYD